MGQLQETYNTRNYSPQKKRGRQKKNSRNNRWKKLMKMINPKIQEAQQTSNTHTKIEWNNENDTKEHHNLIIQNQRQREGGKKGHSSYRPTRKRTKAGSHWKICQWEHSRAESLKHWKGKTLRTQNSLIKTFPDIQKLKEFITKRPTLQKMLKEVSSDGRKKYRSPHEGIKNTPKNIFKVFLLFKSLYKIINCLNKNNDNIIQGL